MNDYLLFGFLPVVYGQVSFLFSIIRSPRSPVGIYLQIGSQAALVIASFFTPIWMPITTVFGWIAWIFYCLFMAFCVFVQAISFKNKVINVDKVYDCQVFAYITEKDGSKTYFGKIKEGDFVTTVAIIDSDSLHKDETIKVIYLRPAKKSAPQLRLYNKELHKMEYETIYLCVKQFKD